MQLATRAGGLVQSRASSTARSSTTPTRPTGRCASTTRSTACRTARISSPATTTGRGLSRHATWSSDKKIDFRPNFADSLLYEHHTTSLVFNDPPITRGSASCSRRSFTPRALEAMQPRIEALVDRLLDRAAERGVIDLIDDFAAAIPMQLIGDLLGIPQDERGPLRDWSLAILGALEPVLSQASNSTPASTRSPSSRTICASSSRAGSKDTARDERRNSLDPDRCQRICAGEPAASGCRSSS